MFPKCGLWIMGIPEYLSGGLWGTNDFHNNRKMYCFLHCVDICADTVLTDGAEAIMSKQLML